MNKVTTKLKYLLPAAPIAGVLVSAALTATGNIGAQGGVQVNQSNGTEASSSGQASLTPDVNVSVNGQPVDVGADNSAQVETGHGQATVTVSGASTESSNPSQTTQSTNPDGTVNISVGSSSNNGSSRTTIRYTGGGTNRFRDNSSVDVHLSGEGSASATQ